MKFSSLIFFIPLVYADPCYPSIRPISTSQVFRPPCDQKPLILYKPYLRSHSFFLRSNEIEVEEDKEEEEEIDEWIEIY